MVPIIRASGLAKGTQMTTRSRQFKCGRNTFKTYFKPAGKGYEIGFTYGGRNFFTSNFINKTEATKWWGFFNKEITSFCKKHWLSNNMPFNWYCNFMTNHLYKCYYTFLDKVFFKNETTFKKAYSKQYKQFLKYRAQYPTEYRRAM